MNAEEGSFVGIPESGPHSLFSLLSMFSLFVLLACLATSSRASYLLHSLGSNEPDPAGSLVPVLTFVPPERGPLGNFFRNWLFGRAASASASALRRVQPHVRTYVYVEPDVLRANAREAFGAWRAAAGRTYADSEAYEQGLSVWLKHLEYVVEHNTKLAAKGKGYRVGMNVFADVEHGAWRDAMGFTAAFVRGGATPSSSRAFRYDGVNIDSLPERVDWTEKGVVTDVKAQGTCGSCWAFSTTGAIEGVDAIVTGELKSLSEQMLIDCETTRDDGCDGGLMDFAFDFVHANGGIDTEESYPYREKQGQCDLNRLNRHVVTIDGFEDVPEDDEVALKKAVAHQPVSVAIEADHLEFQLYSGGVFDDLSCGTDLNHGVLVVGYGADRHGAGGNSTARPYWKVKNSWGALWGEGGFVKLARTVERKLDEGECGVAKMASYPVKTGLDPPEPPPAPPMPPPAPPEPQPVDCDPTTACPPETTCCCMQDYFGFCFQWACCPMPQATCCEDKIHCCPSDMPVCNVAAGTCSKGAGYGGWVPMRAKVAAVPKKEREVVPH